MSSLSFPALTEAIPRETYVLVLSGQFVRYDRYRFPVNWTVPVHPFAPLSETHTPSREESGIRWLNTVVGGESIRGVKVNPGPGSEATTSNTMSTPVEYGASSGAATAYPTVTVEAAPS